MIIVHIINKFQGLLFTFHLLLENKNLNEMKNEKERKKKKKPEKWLCN